MSSHCRILFKVGRDHRVTEFISIYGRKFDKIDPLVEAVRQVGNIPLTAIMNEKLGTFSPVSQGSTERGRKLEIATLRNVPSIIQVGPHASFPPEMGYGGDHSSISFIKPQVRTK